MNPIYSENIGQRLYEAYCESSGWKNYQGNKCPDWLDLTEAVRRHWAAAARKAKELADAGYLQLMENG